MEVGPFGAASLKNLSIDPPDKIENQGMTVRGLGVFRFFHPLGMSVPHLLDFRVDLIVGHMNTRPVPNHFPQIGDLDLRFHFEPHRIAKGLTEFGSLRIDVGLRNRRDFRFFDRHSDRFRDQAPLDLIGHLRPIHLLKHLARHTTRAKPPHASRFPELGVGRIECASHPRRIHFYTQVAKDGTRLLALHLHIMTGFNRFGHRTTF